MNNQKWEQCKSWIRKITIDWKKSPENNKEENYTLREFVFSNFKRAFKLPDTVAIDKIKAEYKSGILTVILPKVKEALPQPKKLIAIK